VRVIFVFFIKAYALIYSNLIFGTEVHLHNIQVFFQFQGHVVKVKVTVATARKFELPQDTFHVGLTYDFHIVAMLVD